MYPRFLIPMWKATEALTLIQAAERAAEADNYASAENLLREAARLQEAHLGPRHADLANTLNNLGIVCEVTGKADDAEQYFRRAVSIARTSLPPDHPFVATSQKNLRDFCESRGRKVEVEEPAKPALEVQAAPPPLEATKPAPDVEIPVKELEVPVKDLEVPVKDVEVPVKDLEVPVKDLEVPVKDVEVTVKDIEVTVKVETPVALEPEDPEATSKKFFTRVALGALGPIAMLMVILAAGLPRLGAPELRGATSPAEPISAPPAPPAPPPPTPAPEPAPAEPIPAPEEPTTTPAVARTKEVDKVAPAASARLEVVRASLCGDIEDWSCDPADDPVPQGPLFFYTQIKSAGVTTIQHRWYQGSRLLQSVELRVQPTRSGYRTFSRNVMKSESAGNWRIEVRSKDGALLHEERFTVR